MGACTVITAVDEIFLRTKLKDTEMPWPTEEMLWVGAKDLEIVALPTLRRRY